MKTSLVCSKPYVPSVIAEGVVLSFTTLSNLASCCEVGNCYEMGVRRGGGMYEVIVGPPKFKLAEKLLSLSIEASSFDSKFEAVSLGTSILTGWHDHWRPDAATRGDMLKSLKLQFVPPKPCYGPQTFRKPDGPQLSPAHE
ncbi:hypothetical protein Tco_0140536 [Tanacetum coccineum]